MNSSARARSGDPVFPSLYDPSFEHDACGVGVVVDIQGRASREIVEKALVGLENLTHRGGVGADPRTSDGTGLLIQIPHRFFATVVSELGDLEAGDYGVAMLFLPLDTARRSAALAEIGRIASDRGLSVIAMRDVPVDPSRLGEQAMRQRPHITQLFIRRPTELSVDGFERALILWRREVERHMEKPDFRDDAVSVISCSARTLVYKGLCLAGDLPQFYPDLADSRMESAMVLFHQRFSTNTESTWRLAQPFHTIAHNGEINTIQGNRTWMAARGARLASDDDRAAELVPLVPMTGSDSLSLDAALEVLRLGGRSLPQALMMCVPEAWEHVPDMDPDRRAFYAFHAGFWEPWDGPAALGFCDGVIAGVALDRNGLRPMRYVVTREGLLVAGSEAGTVELDPASITEHGRLGPGQMILVDTARKVFLHNDALKREVVTAHPYGDWLRRTTISLDIAPDRDDPVPVPVEADAKTRLALTKPSPETVVMQRSFGYTAEDLRLIITPMAGEHKEPTWSMGDDAPLAVLSDVPRPVTSFFRQRFAQVTNPPIDSLRERLVMSLDTWLGPQNGIFHCDPGQAARVHLSSMILSDSDLEAIQTLDRIPVSRVSTVFSLADETLEGAIDRIVTDAERQVRNGIGILILSDRDLDRKHAPVPMALVVGAVHTHLIREGLRMDVDLVCEAGDIWDVHQMAVLIGYGAAAVHPWMALDASASLSGTRGYETTRPGTLRRNYLDSLEYGFLKVMSKMGISTVSGYRGAHIFEVLGLGDGVMRRCFPDTPSRIGGIGFADIEADVRRRYDDAWTEAATRLPDQGQIKFKKDGETHAFAPTIVTALQKAAQHNDRAAYADYRAEVARQAPSTLRDLLEILPAGDPVPLDEVESAAEITRRFVVTAMSLGSLSPEAHMTLSIAMNRIGARSNSGEGGEDPAWYDVTGPDIPHSKVKQVASGRFGVTTRYLTQAEELEIKIAQGAKPGEGGQLPAFKVTAFVARMRHAVEGLPLISPPPHHDIYSIEDLAQLIYDLRQVNPRAKIGVKLVAEAGVGTIAAGVVKARADYVLISGHAGGTGAAPLASIKHAGVPWELGLSETQQTLIRSGLRSRVRLRTDGGLKVPEDIVLAAMLGADEFGFGTSVLVAMGCDMARQCHLNTCPTGIATQRADLRAKFAGTPEMIIGYFDQLTQGIRELMAALGIRSLSEIIGRTDLLSQRSMPGRAATIDLRALVPAPVASELRRKSVEMDHNTETLDDELWRHVQGDLLRDGAASIEAPIRISDRATGARIAGHLTRMREQGPISLDRIHLRFRGSAGQSFGAFLVAGMELSLEGQANDYVGKGMAGGEIAIRPDRETSQTRPMVLAGNTILYGATAGQLFVAGTVGERCMVRNSGATAVIEGAGDHACEYMTGGEALILGPTGRNVGAGMSNGRLWIYDPEDVLDQRINRDSVSLEELTGEDARRVRQLLEQHVALTQSPLGQSLLDEWDAVRHHVRSVVPKAIHALIGLADVEEGAAD